MNNKMKKNADRFLGFADVYENSRPVMPYCPIEIISRYTNTKPSNVVDLGCGTGLSTTIWISISDQIIGVEPSLDMYNIAQSKQTKNMTFINAYAHKTGLEDNWADVIVCSQSFHWMEPNATLKEVDRVLKDGGIFLVIDCDWPPASIWQADRVYEELNNKVRRIENEIPEVKESFICYNKDHHLSNIKNSNYFRYVREIVFSNTELCTVDRYINIMLSQGSLQNIIKKRPDLITNDIIIFKETIHSLFTETQFKIDFSYRMRLGIK